MSRIQPTYADRVRYILQNDNLGQAIVNEPIGWRNDDTEFVRSKKYHGVTTQMTNQLQFVGLASDYIQNAYDTYGINAIIRLVKDERHPKTDVWTRVYDGFLDMTTYEVEDSIVGIKFNSSGLFKLIKSRLNEKIEITRKDTLSGESVSAINQDKVLLKGRKIFLKSYSETDNSSRFTDSWRMNFDEANVRYGFLPIPAEIQYKSDTQFFTVNNNTFFTSSDGDMPAQVQMLFYGDNDRNKTLNINLKLDCKVPFVYLDDTREEEFQIRLTTYKNGTAYDFKENRIFFSQHPASLVNQQLSINESLEIELLEGESLAFYFWGKARFGTGIGSDGDFNMDFSDIYASINIEEDSFFDTTTSDVLLPYEVCDRMIEVITDRKDAFKSDVLGRTDIYPSGDYRNYQVDGEASLIGLANGFMVRGFDENTSTIDSDGESENKFKPLTSSLGDFLKSYFAVWNLGMGIEKIGFQERVILEPLEYFYNQNVTIHLGKKVNGVYEYNQVSKVKRTIAEEYYNSSVNFGYEIGEDYEEAVGLDEYNKKASFTTSIKVVEKSSEEGVSKYRADSYGMEFARRKQFDLYPSEDTNYDTKVFLMDLKRSSGTTLEQRYWQDDFDKAPTGVYDPNSAQNLRLSPVNTLLRHGNFIAAPLTKYKSDYLRYASSEANSNLKTQPIGGVERGENEDIQNSDLGKARYTPDYVEFEYEVDFDIMQQVQGKSVIFGKEIMNIYGLVIFRNEKNVLEKGYLINLKPNGAGKWKLLKYNR